MVCWGGISIASLVQHMGCHHDVQICFPAPARVACCQTSTGFHRTAAGWQAWAGCQGAGCGSQESVGVHLKREAGCCTEQGFG